MAERSRKHWIASLGLAGVLVSALGAVAAAAGERPCPPGRDAVDVRITPRVEYISERSSYIYRYTLTVLPSSRLPVGWWMMEVDPDAVRSVEAAEGWLSHVSGERILMRARHAGREPPAESRTGYALEPGSSLDGFVIESSRPPGPKTAYVTGELRLEPFRSELEAERTIARCEALGKSLKESSKQVRTTGPADSGTPGSAHEPRQ